MASTPVKVWARLLYPKARQAIANLAVDWHGLLTLSSAITGMNGLYTRCIKRFIWLSAAMVISACGGGGGGETIVAPSPPTANANAFSMTARSSAVTGGSGVVIRLYQALYGMAPSYALLIN